MIDCLQDRSQKVVLIGLSNEPVKGTEFLYKASLFWMASDIWQAILQLEDGRSLVIPENVRDKPHTQIFLNPELEILS